MPKLIKTKPKYRCDFCRYTATLRTISKHENLCWLNPDRMCPRCKNTGLVSDEIAGVANCPYCEKYTTKEQWEEGYDKAKDALAEMKGE